ncbi:MAG: HDOD domain-containing protein [Pseudomonadota bacterium]
MTDLAPPSPARRSAWVVGDRVPAPQGRFELQQALVTTGQFTQWRALDRRGQRPVTIRQWAVAPEATAAALERWLQAAERATHLSHAFIVPVLEADVLSRQPYIVHEQMHGPTLAEHLARQGRCTPHDAVALVVDVLDALEAAHAADLVHGRVDLDHVAMDPQRHARLLGLGWHAPAFGAGEVEASAADDVRSAAQVLVHLLTGSPWVGAAGAGRALPAVLADALDEGLRTLLQRALGQDGATPFAGATELRDALRAWAAPVSAPTAASNATLDFLLRRMRHKSDFPALSDSVARIQRVAHSEDDSISDLTHEILKDVALTHKLLRLVNSVHYAHAGRGTISTVSRAVSLVGFNAVRNMAMSLVLLDHMQDKAHAEQMREEFLRSMMAGSVAAELCGPGQGAEEAFIGAMFQNLGRMLCSFYFPEEAQQVRSIVAGGRLEGGEEAAAMQVLGLGFEDLGTGVARVWGLPESLQRCMRKPLGSPAQRPPEQGVERLRWVALAANEVADILLHSEPARLEERMQGVGTRYSRTLALTPAAIAEATLRARHKLVSLAETLELRVPAGTPAARLLQLPLAADDGATVPEDALAHHELKSGEVDPLPAVLASQAGGSVSVAQVNEVLSAGVQDVTNAMVDTFALNDVLRMILETMFRALGFRRMVFCLRDARTEVLVGRFGLGEGSEAAVRAMRVPLKVPGDLFAAVSLRAADTLINDATDPRIHARLPEWYRTGLNAPSFLLLPLQIKGQTFALIYADQSVAGGIVVDDKALGLLRTLRNQAVMAFRQAG